MKTIRYARRRATSPAAEARELQSPDLLAAGDGWRGIRGGRVRSPDCGGPRRARSTGRFGRAGAGGPRGGGKGPGQIASSHSFPPPGVSQFQQKLSGLLTSDSRRWLLNASRPLGDAGFPLPPPPLPLLLPLAGGLPAPGATGFSMRLWSAAPQLLRALCPRRPRHPAPAARPHPLHSYWLRLFTAAPPRDTIGCSTSWSGT